ncbi:N-acetylglucosaminyl deacetylase, LmbE family [Shewanella morhuae]|uniref:PIG-L deacetylase family protein n=1 Tax=Shewanella TaxID=22 RepID=UPI000956E043|nr:PIG-L deacetylase family protein [Shewanella morhuae]SIQ49058.1 N-acetylglucosaminyl deacetylase, LmbE family [Shewanella morhuae]
MFKKIVLVVAPHADDESLGCGGSLLKHKKNGDEVHWLIVTQISSNSGYSDEAVLNRQNEVLAVTEQYGFKSVHQLAYSPALLDTQSKSNLVDAFSIIINQIKPQIVYTPFRNDVHSDHEVVFDVVASTTKSFRYPFIEKILAYETLSETDFNIKPGNTTFSPNVFVDISEFMEKKILILKLYTSELGEFPFPRSIKAIRSLGHVRGAQAGCDSAEAFMLLKEIIK